MKKSSAILQILFLMLLATVLTLPGCSDEDDSDNLGEGDGTVSVEDSTYILDQGIRTIYDDGEGFYAHNIILHASSLNAPDEKGYFLHLYFFTDSETFNGQTLEYTYPNENIPNTVYFAFFKTGYDSGNQSYEWAYDVKDGSLTVLKEGGSFDISFDFVTSKIDSAGNELAQDVPLNGNYSGSLSLEGF